MTLSKEKLTRVINASRKGKKIKKKRRLIYKRMIAESPSIARGNFTAISTDDLQRLFELYDEHFFRRYLTGEAGVKVSFRLSKRMTRSAGKTSYNQRDNSFVITLSTELLFQTFLDVDREIRVNGLACQDRLEAAMVVWEHETIHLLEWLLHGTSSCSQLRFRLMARRIFGHTDVTHQLVTRRERAQVRYGLQVGDRVKFDFDGTIRYGFIHRITKRATVMVNDQQGAYTDPHGTRFNKVYVPLQCLRPDTASGVKK